MTAFEVIEVLRELNENYFQPDKDGEFDSVNEAIEIAISIIKKHAGISND